MEKLRTGKILDYLKKHRSCTLAELMEVFGVSSATIHRDVAELSRRDAVKAVRGGLVWNEPHASRESPTDYTDRVVANRTAKTAAARRALDAIVEGDIIFLDSSTTVYELAMLLRESSLSRLTIITNSLAVMQNFRKMPREWVMIGLGGNYDASLNSMLGATVLGQLGGLNITKAFFSAFGLDRHSATTNHERQAELIRSVIAAAEKSYLLVDSSKIGRTGIYRIAARSAFHAIFTG